MKCTLATTALLLLSATALAEDPRFDLHGDPLPAGAIARLGTIQSHPGMKTLHFSADGRTLISTCDTTVKHWDVATGRIKRAITREPPKGGNQMISMNAAVRIITTPRLVVVRSIESDKQLNQVAHRHDELFLSAMSMDGSVAIFMGEHEEINSKHFILRNGSHALESIGGMDRLVADIPPPIFSNDGRRFAGTRSTPKGRETGCWFTATGALVCKIEGDWQPIAFSPRSESLLASDQSGFARLFNSMNGKELPVRKIPMSEHTPAAAFSPDRRFVAVNDTTEVILWDIKAGAGVFRFRGQARCFAFSPDGKRLAMGNDQIRVVDVETGQDTWPDYGPLLSGREAGGPSIGGFSKGKIVLLNEDNRQISVWDASGGKPIHVVGLPKEIVGSWLDSGKDQFFAINHFKCMVWDLKSGKQVRDFSIVPPSLADRGGHVAAVAPSVNGKHFSTLKRVLSDDESFENWLIRWNAADGRLLGTRTSHAFAEEQVSRADCIAGKFYVDGRRVDPETGRIRSIVHAPHGYSLHQSVAGSRDGRIHACWVTREYYGPARIIVSEAANVTAPVFLPIAEREEYDGFYFSDDNRWLAIGGAELDLWDLATLSRVSLPQYRRSDGATYLTNICDVAFLPGNKLLATYCDGTALVWRLPAGTEKPPPQRINPRTWDDLASAEARPGRDAVWALRNEPARAVALLRERLKPVTAPDPVVVGALVKQLDEAKFARREAAMRGLRTFGHVVEEQLTGLMKSSGPEQRQRLRQAIAALQDDGPLTADERRACRAVEVLEHIGTTEAKALLAEYAKGHADAVLTREAKATRERMGIE